MRLFSLYGCVKGLYQYICTNLITERIETEVPTFRKGLPLGFMMEKLFFHACPVSQSVCGFFAFGKDFPVLFGQFLSVE